MIFLPKLTYLFFLYKNEICSGHIYSREAIVSYLLTQKQKIKRQKQAYDTHLENILKSQQESSTQSLQQSQQSFLQKDQGSTQITTAAHASSFQSSLSRNINTQSKSEGTARLKRSSYWLSESQPETKDSAPSPPPERPPSPMSGNPLRLKDLIPLTLKRDGGSGKVTCAVSGKAITTQPVVVLSNTGAVMLKQVLESIQEEPSSSKKASSRCPVTGKKFQPKHVVELRKGASGFAASGETVAKKYRPTLT